MPITIYYRYFAMWEVGKWVGGVGDCCCAHISKQRCKLGLEIQ